MIGTRIMKPVENAWEALARTRTHNTNTVINPAVNRILQIIANVIGGEDYRGETQVDVFQEMMALNTQQREAVTMALINKDFEVTDKTPRYIVSWANAKSPAVSRFDR